jgi:hypothetical protein
MDYKYITGFKIRYRTLRFKLDLKYLVIGNYTLILHP